MSETVHMPRDLGHVIDVNAPLEEEAYKFYPQFIRLLARKGKTVTVLRELLAWAEKANGIIGDQMDTIVAPVTPGEILRAREYLIELQGDDDE